MALLDPLALAPGALFRGRYRLVARLGEGGMSVVWQVHDQQTGEPRALKLNRQPDDPRWQARFLAECRLSGLLGRDDRGFVRAVDYDVADPTWMVMDLVEGARPLGDGFRLGRSPAGALARVLTQLERAAALVGRVHALGVVHRDLKPDNLLVDVRGEVYLSDFGLAKPVGPDSAPRSGVHTHPGTVLGSPAYMPIEQFGGAEAVGPAADVFALGAVLYELVTGAPPFGGDDLPNIVARHKAGPAPALSARVRPWPAALDPLEPVVRAALSAAPHERPDIPTLRAALREAIAGLEGDVAASIPAPEPARPAAETVTESLLTAPPPARRWRWGPALGLGATAAGLLAIAAALVAGGSVAIWALTRPAAPQACPVAGQVRTEDSQMQCCWPGQGWVASQGACVGAPRCPAGTLPFGDTCAQAPPAAPAPGTAWRSPSGIALGWVPAGTVRLGSPAEEPDREPDEGPQHDVAVDGLWVMRTEVPQALWAAVMGSNPAQAHRAHRDGEEGDDCVEQRGVSLVGPELPVVCVDWFDAVRFANALSEREGLRPPYRFVDQQVRWDRAADGYRLLTEAEWEHAARAGLAGQRFAGAADDAGACAVANVGDAAWGAAGDEAPGFACDDGFAAVAPVGRRRPNAWGLFDLTGNVWEWVYDRYAPYPGAPDRRVDREFRAFRGGSWSNGPAHARVANRGFYAPDYRQSRLGLRLGRPAPPPR